MYVAKIVVSYAFFLCTIIPREARIPYMTVLKLESDASRRRDDHSSAISPISIMSCLDWLTHYDIMSKIGHYLSRSYMTYFKERNAHLFIVKSWWYLNRHAHTFNMLTFYKERNAHLFIVKPWWYLTSCHDDHTRISISYSDIFSSHNHSYEQYHTTKQIWDSISFVGLKMSSGAHTVHASCRWS